MKAAPRLLDAILVAIPLALALHFLSLRMHQSPLPRGDEGSWLSAAAELARGNGFTTRWLEYHWLEPYALPRPDDFRFPALTGILGAAFLACGTSWRTAQWTVACVFLLFALASHLVMRRALGRWPAYAGLYLACFSLLQLEWNSQVYTEGLFGLVLALVLGGSLSGDARSRWWWARLGAGVGLLYLVRTNGLLFAPGLAWLFLRRRKELGLGWDRLAAAAAGLVAVASPWLIRTWIQFGSPLHVAGSGGLMRADHTEPATYGLSEYFRLYGFLFPLRRMAEGSWEFLRTLHHFEHGLEVMPLLLALAAVARRRPFYNPFAACGFLLTGAACAYVSFNSWAGVRYAGALLPFVYAYGLALPPFAADRLTARAPRWALPAVGAAAIALLLLPTLGPHRFHERRFSRLPDPGPDIADHVARLRALVPEGGRYYAGELGRLNFLADRDCVGLQELYDSGWFTKSMDAFRPGAVVLTHRETGDTAMGAALARMRSSGYALDTLSLGNLGVYYGLRPVP